jgi:hypothetical protein
MLGISIKGGTVALRRHLTVAQHQIAVQRNLVGLHVLEETEDGLGRNAQGFGSRIDEVVLRHGFAPPQSVYLVDGKTENGGQPDARMQSNCPPVGHLRLTFRYAVVCFRFEGNYLPRKAFS